MYCRNETDETLVMLTLAGESSAFEVLVKRHESAVIASAMAVTKTRFMAEDAAQDAFVTAWMKLDTLIEPKKFAAWVCRIAKNAARNMVCRYSSYLPLEVVENCETEEDGSANPIELYLQEEERNEVNKTIGMLPEKVRIIIDLHYFKGLSVTEIAEKLQISEGNVKRQLFDGRKQIRKELCAMDEKYSDTLVMRVIKKVEELKLWQLRNNKGGFDKVYREVLREVEELPESPSKQHALADVLTRGWWWIPGNKNDVLFARISDAAKKGKNEEVMDFIVTKEDSHFNLKKRIDFVRNEQIPKLEKAGLSNTLGHEWFWLAWYLDREGRKEEAEAAYEQAEKILGSDDAFRGLVPFAQKLRELYLSRYKDAQGSSYFIYITAEEYRTVERQTCRWTKEELFEGELVSVLDDIINVFRNASVCDGRFFADIGCGQTFRGSDGTALTFVSDCETVETPSGRYENCRMWETRFFNSDRKHVCRTYYSEGVGIVRQDNIIDGIPNTLLLKKCDIKGGSGFLPFFTGNTWEYSPDFTPDTVISELVYTVSFADRQRSIITMWSANERKGYDQNSWVDAVQEISQDYYFETEEDEWIKDLTPAIERAERLAKTRMEKAHTRAAVSVMRRLMETEPKLNPDPKAEGHWNFFERNYIRKNIDSIKLTEHNHRWSFEWKLTDHTLAETPILYNDILGILHDACNCIWSDSWYVGASAATEYVLWDMSVKTRITCADGGTVTTKAGTFENCLKLCLDISGMDDGFSYIGGKKAYYFAEGIGIVRTENEYCGGACVAVYELTSYKGTGIGFMPLEDGMVRKYDARDLTDGYRASVEYTFVSDDDGDIVMFSDKSGMRDMLPAVTQYSSIEAEIIERELREEGKVQEGQAAYGRNNFHLFLHTIARPSFNKKTAERSNELHGFFRQLMESFGENGEVPPAWYSLYAWSALIQSAALFGAHRKDEGYEVLDTAIQYSEKVSRLHEGDLLEVGKTGVFSDIRYVYGKGYIQLPDGSKEPVEFDYRMDWDADLYDILTARGGWEWFNSVRDENRFKECVKRAKEIIEHR